MDFGLGRLARAALRAGAVAIALHTGAAVAQESYQTALVDPAPTPTLVQPAEPVRTRFIATVDKKVDIEVKLLREPNRVIVDMPEVKVALPDLENAKAKGLLKSCRGGSFAPGRTRIVIEVKEPVIVEQALIEKSDGGAHVLKIDLVSAGAKFRSLSRKTLKTQPAGLGAAGLQPPMPRPAMRPNERLAKSFKPIIVIDPGHGGHDTGAKRNGTVEKEVVLAFGLTLREKLEKTGRYKVLMTRDTDEFIPLDERRAYAERHGAHLFIAIHADYAGTKARGATIYSLRSGVADSLRRSAKGNLTSEELSRIAAASGQTSELREILSELAGRDVEVTQERTNVFARSVIETMGEATPMREEPEQFAAFRVLKTAQFPSVLIELAYVTNQQDAANLKSETWRDKVADSILTAVGNYFSNDLAGLPM